MTIPFFENVFARHWAFGYGRFELKQVKYNAVMRCHIPKQKALATPLWKHENLHLKGFKCNYY
jgi:hypothetical protein